MLESSIETRLEGGADPPKQNAESEDGYQYRDLLPIAGPVVVGDRGQEEQEREVQDEDGEGVNHELVHGLPIERADLVRRENVFRDQEKQKQKEDMAVLQQEPLAHAEVLTDLIWSKGFRPFIPLVAKIEIEEERVEKQRHQREQKCPDAARTVSRTLCHHLRSSDRE